MNATEPIRPDLAETQVSPDVEAILRDRLSSFDQDRKAASPASDVFRRILQSPKP